MPYPRLIPHLKERLTTLGFETPLPAQETFLPPIKSGADLFCLAPKGSGRSTTLILSVVQRLKEETNSQIPRAIIFAKDKWACQDLEEAFRPFLKGTNLDIFSAFDQHDITGQRDTIYTGMDIVIGTPKRMCDLFLTNGLNTGDVEMMLVEDADFLAQNNMHSLIMRIAESSGKCQYVVFAEKMNSRMERFKDTFMHRARKAVVKTGA